MGMDNRPLERLIDAVAVVTLMCVFAWILRSALLRWAGL